MWNKCRACCKRISVRVTLYPSSLLFLFDDSCSCTDELVIYVAVLRPYPFYILQDSIFAAKYFLSGRYLHGRFPATGVLHKPSMVYDYLLSSTFINILNLHRWWLCCCNTTFIRSSSKLSRWWPCIIILLAVNQYIVIIFDLYLSVITAIKRVWWDDVEMRLNSQNPTSILSLVDLFHICKCFKFPF